MKNNLLRFSIALIFIMIICWCGYQFIYEGSNHGENNLAWMDKRRLLKHCLNYLWLLLIFIIGYWGLKHQHPIWLIKVWIIFYLTALLVLPAFGIIDLLIGGFAKNIKFALGDSMLINGCQHHTPYTTYIKYMLKL